MTFSAAPLSSLALSEAAGTSAAAATTVTLSGPPSGYISAASSAFVVGADGTLTASTTVTPNDGGAGGTFTPTSVTISAGTPTATFTYTPNSTVGTKTIGVTNSGGLSNPPSLSYSALSNLPAKPTGVVATPGNASATVSFTPGDTGGAAVTYTVTASPGGATASGSASPITIGGLTNLTTYTVTVTGANVNGTGASSDPSNSFTPAPAVSISKLAPFVDSDVLGTVVAQAYEEVGGAMAPVGAAPTVNTVVGIANGRQVRVSVTPNGPDGGFYGVLRWASGSGEYFVDELNIPTSNPSPLAGNRKVCKVCNLPFGTDVSGTVGYQLFDAAGAAVGGLVTTGILTVPGATNTDKLCTTLDLPAGFSGYIRWQNGSGVYSIDEVQVPGIAQSLNTRTVTLTLNGAGARTGLKWAFRDSFTGAVMSSGTAGTTNGSSVFTASVSTTLAAGATGWLEVSNTDGTAGSDFKGFGGPVVVS